MRVNEQDIEKVLEDTADWERLDLQEELQSKEPELFEYLTSSDLVGLSDDELGLLIYILFVVQRVVEDTVGASEFDIDEFLDIEDTTLSVLENIKSTDKKLDALFEMTPEEDLLAFAEDMTMLDEENYNPLVQVLTLATVRSYIDHLIPTA